MTLKKDNLKFFLEIIFCTIIENKIRNWSLMLAVKSLFSVKKQLSKFNSSTRPGSFLVK